MSHHPSTRPTTCLRHPRHVWIASCPDCTAWYLAGHKAARGTATAARQPSEDVSSAA
ncbi:hypothetical protein JOD57_004730 [Geodermatophilus bullaregiensis]|uniref:hypothetical protein n=1 Tax=Geodermatophilus bullaregiensis TaxID=1564160 RepID=UPI00195BEA78|nr:hypothetical protein [Geodermatophilus bullaregiensis]MBM7808893.1 hypothetical protein [Geodermatophilus bullaregiensis]